MSTYLVAEGGSSPSVLPAIHRAERRTPRDRNLWHATRRALVAFGQAIARGFDGLMQRIEMEHSAPREAFFAQAVDLCDLEHRIRHYEHTGLTHY